MTDKEVQIREQIVLTAEELFAQYGIRSISIDDICKRLGISKKTFYVHFDQKADLVDAVLETHNEVMEVAAWKWLESQTIEATLRDTVAQIRRIGKVRETPPMIYDLQKYYPACYEKQKKRFADTHYSILVQYLQRGKAEGYFRAELDEELCAEFLTRITMDMLADKVKAAQDPKRAKLLRFMADTLMRGLVSEQGAKILNSVDN